jgi:ABC-type amino acid transport substrate-binding protein
VSKSNRREAVRVLRRFVRGQAGVDELQGAVKLLDRQSVAQVCLDSGVAGGRRARPVASTLVGLLSVLLDPRRGAPPAKIERTLKRVRSWIEEGEPAPRDFLPTVLRDVLQAIGEVRLGTMASPVPFSFAGAARDADWHGWWVDVGLLSAHEENVTLIPFSVFTAGFFRRELPAMLSRIAESTRFAWVRRDAFHYHPENDQAVFLRERFPLLAEAGPPFHYYVDDAGLAEIVLEVPAISAREVRFASRLFCLRNGVGAATLDGKPVPGAGRSTSPP